MSTAAGEQRPVRPVGAGFVSAYTLAQLGSYISFVPLLQVIAPLKAAQIDPAHKTLLLSEVVFYGALVASVANLVAGALSDHTTSRFGRRRPWIAAGAAGVLAAYALIHAAHTATTLLAGVCLFQLLFNLMYAAVVAVIADRVPDLQKGQVAALSSIGYPLGTLVGLVIVGLMFQSEGARFLALGAVVVAGIAPLLFLLDDPPLARAARGAASLRQRLAALWVDPREHPDFALAWAGRLLVIVGVSLVQSYMLFYLQDAMHYSKLFAGQPAEKGLSGLTALWAATNIGTALLGGMASDRFGRRKGFVVGGALLLAASLLGFALAPDWRSLLAAYALYGVGSGCYYAVDMALVTQVLPTVRNAGKDLGIVNLSNTLPQAVAPMLAVGFMSAVHTDFRALFLVGAVLTALGALLVLPIKSVR